MAKRYEFRRIVTEKGYSFPIGLETVSRTTWKQFLPACRQAGIRLESVSV